MPLLTSIRDWKHAKRLMRWRKRRAVKQLTEPRWRSACRSSFVKIFRRGREAASLHRSQNFLHFWGMQGWAAAPLRLRRAARPEAEDSDKGTARTTAVFR